MSTHTLLASPSYSGISPVLDALMPYVTPHHYHGQTHIIEHGDPAHSLWIVLDGWVKLSRFTPDGQETITGLCACGDLFGEATLFAHANYPYRATTLGQSTRLAAVHGQQLRPLIANKSELAHQIIALLNERTKQSQLQLEHRSTLSAAQRLGCFLLKLCTQSDTIPIELNIPVEKHILATYLGMKPETLSRSQQQLKKLGICINGQQITIPSTDTLREFVCNSCSEMGSCIVDDIDD